MIPDSYDAAKLRAVLPFDDADNVGISFDVVASGLVTRIKLSRADAEHMVNAFNGYKNRAGSSMPKADQK